jgi:polyisoprenoid-binding protein YceI
MTRRAYHAGFLLLAIVGSVGSAWATLTGIGSPEVQFLALGPAGMKINGTSNDLSVAEKDGKLLVTAPLTNLKTGIGLRDKHLRNYLHTDQHPNASLLIERDKLKLPAEGQTVENTSIGQFTLNGVTKPVKFRYKAKRMGSDYLVQGMSELNIKEFAIEQPCYLGVCVDPNVKLKVAFKAREK